MKPFEAVAQKDFSLSSKWIRIGKRCWCPICVLQSACHSHGPLRCRLDELQKYPVQWELEKEPFASYLYVCFKYGMAWSVIALLLRNAVLDIYCWFNVIQLLGMPCFPKNKLLLGFSPFAPSFQAIFVFW